LQYQKHHFVVEGAEFYQLHQFFSESYEQVQEHIHENQSLDGLGGVPAASFSKLAELCCFEQEQDGVYNCRQMVEHDSSRASHYRPIRQAAQAESLGDRATRYLYETILLKTEERAFHLDHFLTHDSLTPVSWLIMGQPINKTTWCESC